MRSLISILLLASASAVAQAQCHVESGELRPHLIELFTSEGCSSCPPADTWLRSLHANPDAVALAFHVDYWDGLGWRDRFDDPHYTARQGEIAARDGGTTIYTPQVVLDGRSWSSWYRGGHVPAASSAAVSMRLSAMPGSNLHVQVDTESGPAAAAGSKPEASLRTYVALVEDGLVSQVRTGENKGATLHHDHVVRAFAGPLPLSQSAIDLAVPGDVDLAHASLVAFLQNPDDGSVAQVVTLPLAQCRANATDR